MLTAGSFLLTSELLCLHCAWELLCLQLELFLVSIGAFSLTVEVFCLQWENASNKHQNGL